MDNVIEKFPTLKFTEMDSNSIEDEVVRESPITIVLNNQELATLLCSPTNLRYLAIGFLFSEGLIKSKDAIRKIIVDERKGVVQVETAGGGEFDGEALFKRIMTLGCRGKASFHSATDVQGRVKVESEVKISPLEVLALVNEFQQRSRIYQATGGVHSAALCDMKNILVFSEDIGRHNAIDKIFGECVLNDIATEDYMIITSGRVSSEILLKIARRNVPIIISKSAPTNLGLRLAADLGVTVVGFARGRRMNVYTHVERITTDEK